MKKWLICGASLAAGLWALGGTAHASETIVYKYDAKGRLVRVERTGTVNNGVTAQYQYDKAHNRRRVIVTGSPNLPPP